MKRKYRNHCGIEENRRLYSIWSKMKSRCYDKEMPRYKDYGGRGITICNEWLENFDVFADWAHENGYECGLTIERMDVDGNYEPSNCCWITLKEQALNTRQTRWIEYKGEKKPLKVWCDELNLPYDATHNRIDNGWSVEDAFTKPLFDVSKSFVRKCKEHNINPCTARDRIIKLGWTEEAALNTPSLGRGTHPRGEYVSLGIQAKCRVCGKTFTKNNAKQIYCGSRCRSESKNKRWRERDRV